MNPFTFAINAIIVLLLYIALSNSDIAPASSSNQVMGMVLASIYIMGAVLTKLFSNFVGTPVWGSSLVLTSQFAQRQPVW